MDSTNTLLNIVPCAIGIKLYETQSLPSRRLCTRVVGERRQIHKELLYKVLSNICHVNGEN